MGTSYHQPMACKSDTDLSKMITEKQNKSNLMVRVTLRPCLGYGLLLDNVSESICLHDTPENLLGTRMKALPLRPRARAL